MSNVAASSSGIRCRRATQADGAVIATFNRAMAKETEDIELPVDATIAGVCGLIAQPQYGFYVVAEIDGKVAGSLLVTYEWSDWRNGLYWWIQSVYVAPEFRRGGVYAQLHDVVRNMAKADVNVRGIRLYVANSNATAQKAYRKVGMVETGYRIYEEIFAH